jgi:hypothetical protein
LQEETENLRRPRLLVVLQLRKTDAQSIGELISVQNLKFLQQPLQLLGQRKLIGASMSSSVERRLYATLQALDAGRILYTINIYARNVK